MAIRSRVVSSSKELNNWLALAEKNSKMVTFLKDSSTMVPRMDIAEAFGRMQADTTLVSGRMITDMARERQSILMAELKTEDGKGILSRDKNE